MKFPFSRALLLGLLTFVFTLNLNAKDFSFSEQKVSYKIPDEWKRQSIPQVLVFAYASEGSRRFSLAAIPTDRSTKLTSPAFIQGFEHGLSKGGAIITKRQHLSLRDVDFYVVGLTQDMAKGPPMQGRAYVTLANGYLYTIDVIKFGGDPQDDKELMAMVDSFNFIGTPEVH